MGQRRFCCSLVNFYDDDEGGKTEFLVPNINDITNIYIYIPTSVIQIL